MKTLLLVVSLLIAGLTSYSQVVVVGPDPGTGPNPNPNGICGGRFCFTNTTGCFMSVSFSFQEMDETCPCDRAASIDPIYLAAGESGCIEGFVCDNGCLLCPRKYTFNICATNSYPCFSITESEVGGQGYINCDGGPYRPVYWRWDPATGTYIITE